MLKATSETFRLQLPPRGFFFPTNIHVRKFVSQRTDCVEVAGKNPTSRFNSCLDEIKMDVVQSEDEPLLVYPVYSSVDNLNEGKFLLLDTIS